MNAFWREWLAAEVGYLRTGKPFAGRVSEPAIAGFWQAMGVWVRAATPSFPEWPVTSAQQGLVPGGYQSARGWVATIPTWPAIASQLGAIDRAGCPRGSPAFPPRASRSS
jgi:hypothetical protein